MQFHSVLCLLLESGLAFILLLENPRAGEFVTHLAEDDSRPPQLFSSP